MIVRWDITGLSVADDEGKLVDAMYVDLPNGKTRCVPYDELYYELALAKRAALRVAKGDSVRARWVLRAVKRVTGGHSDYARLHFVDWGDVKESGTYGWNRVNGGSTLRLKKADIPSELAVKRANEDPNHPLWDAMLPLLNPHTQETP